MGLPPFNQTGLSDEDGGWGGRDKRSQSLAVA